MWFHFLSSSPRRLRGVQGPFLKAGSVGVEGLAWDVCVVASSKDIVFLPVFICLVVKRSLADCNETLSECCPRSLHSSVHQSPLRPPIRAVADELPVVLLLHQHLVLSGSSKVGFLLLLKRKESCSYA